MRIHWHDLAENYKFPCLLPTDLISEMISLDLVNKLMGECPVAEMEEQLLLFWRRYAKEYPRHEIYSKGCHDDIPLRRSLPLYLHGDEGRGYKRTGIMLISMQGAIGRGTSPFKKRHQSPATQQHLQGLNINGNSYDTRYLLAGIPKKVYSTLAWRYTSIFDRLVDDFVRLQSSGFAWRSQQWRVIVLGLKGDLPYMTKTAGLTRHYLRAKRSQDSGSEAAGVCFLCRAGQNGVDWEDFNENSLWSRLPCTVPWTTPPSFLRLYHDPQHPERFLKPDIWHNFHGGVGKDFVSSSIAELLPVLPGRSIPAKCDHLNTLLFEWTQKPGGQMPHSGAFCRERIGLTSYQVTPDASWSKHDDTRVYLMFLEDLLGTRVDLRQGNELLSKVFEATVAVNKSFRILYQSGLWLTSAEAGEAGRLGRFFLAKYVELARETFAAHRLRFPLHVKLHMLDHSWRWLAQRSMENDFVLNVLAESVQMCEDFVGHTARLSRRVSPVATALRLLQTYCLRAMQVWVPRK